MGKITQKKRLQCYYRIYEQIYHDNTIAVCEIAENTKISRNTVSKYLQTMYENGILQGPSIRIKPAQNYTEYIYFMRFSDPYMAFQGFKEFPHVVYCALLFGKWNIMVIADRLFDFSRLVGFQEMVYQGKRGVSKTLPVNLISWKKSVQKVEKYVEHIKVKCTKKEQLKEKEKGKKKSLPIMSWEKKEWKLFSIFNDNLRKKIMPLLKKTGVRYETYKKWKKDVITFCTRHVGFYPQGYATYDHHCFLFSTDYKDQVTKVFSFFPTTSFVMEVGNCLLVIVSIVEPDITRWLYCIITVMKVKGIIKKFQHAHCVIHADTR